MTFRIQSIFLTGWRRKIWLEEKDYNPPTTLPQAGPYKKRGVIQKFKRSKLKDKIKINPVRRPSLLMFNGMNKKMSNGVN